MDTPQCGAVCIFGNGRHSPCALYMQYLPRGLEMAEHSCVVLIRDMWGIRTQMNALV